MVGKNNNNPFLIVLFINSRWQLNHDIRSKADKVAASSTATVKHHSNVFLDRTGYLVEEEEIANTLGSVNDSNDKTKRES